MTAAAGDGPVALSSGKTSKDAWIPLAVFLLPAILIITILVAIPLLGVVYSGLVSDAGITLANYEGFWSDRHYIRGLVNPATTGVMAAATSLIVACPIALSLRFGPHLSRRCIALIVTSPVLIGPQNPIAGLIQTVFPGTLFNLLFTRAGVMVGLVYTLTLFMILSLVTNMRNIDCRMLSAARSLGARSLGARSLGAGSWTVLLRIILPLSVPGILTGCFAVVSMSVTSYVLPILLAGSGCRRMAQLISGQSLLIYNWPAGHAVSIILLAASAFLVRRVVARKLGGAR